MFTLLPSLYLTAVQYIQRWNASYYYEEKDNQEEIIKFDSKHIHQSNLQQTSNPIKSTDLIEAYDNTSYVIDQDLLESNHKLTIHSDTSDKNDNLSTKDNDKNSQGTETQLPTVKSNKSLTLLNMERGRVYTDGLAENDVIFLMNETGFSREQILNWYQDFLRDCPDGKLSKSKFIDIYQQFYTKGQVVKFCEHAFRVFDKDGSGSIDFIEFLLAVSLTSSHDEVRKSELFFSMYDIDRNGLIDENEMRCVIESIYELMGIETNDTTIIDMKVKNIFAKAKSDQPGYLTKDEFALACKNDRYIRKLLVPKTKATKHH